MSHSPALPSSVLLPPDVVLAPCAQRALSEADAIEIWIARWFRVPQRQLLARYGCDARRFYEIWEETRFIGSRAKALDALRLRYPTSMDRFDPGAHRRFTRAPHPDQLALFE
jgi:hypothetical protein